MEYNKKATLLKIDLSDSTHFELLDKYMKQSGFQNSIRDELNGVIELPKGQYFYEDEINLASVVAYAKQSINKMNCNYSLVASKIHSLWIEGNNGNEMINKM